MRRVARHPLTRQPLALQSLALWAAAVLGMAMAMATPALAAPKIDVLVAGRVIHGIQGLAFGPDGLLYGASFYGQSIYKLDPASGRAEVAVPPHAGEGDDLMFGPAGTPAEGLLVWTSFDKVMAMRPGGAPFVLAGELPRVNPMTFSPDGRLFVAQSGTPDNALLELDIAGRRPPRIVAQNQGPLNGFAFGPDGRIYAPLFGTDEVVAIDITTGLYSKIAKGVGSPSAVKVGPDGNLIAVDYKKGDIWHITAKTGATRLVVSLPPPIDNLVIRPDGQAYIADPTISTVMLLDPVSGKVTDVTRGHFNITLGMTMTVRDGKPALLVADPMGYHFVDPASGLVHRVPWEVGRHASAAVAANHAVTVTASQRGLRRIDRATDQIIAETAEVKAPSGVVLTAAGDVIAAEPGAGHKNTGRIVRWSAAGLTTVADGLSQPTALAWFSDDVVLVTETEAGVVARIELGSGRRTVIAAGFDRPNGVAVLPDGRIAVAEGENGRIFVVDATGKSKTEIAGGLALSVAGFRVPPTTPVGLAADADGTLYVSCPGDNRILKITDI